MLRDAQAPDWPAVLAMNGESVALLSPMDDARLAKLAKASCYFRVVEQDGEAAAFLLAFRKGADYDGATFRLFEQQPSDFIYIDRVVVDARFRGRRIADLLYDDIAGFARGASAGRLLCEAYVTNDTSLRFHRRRGFAEVGRQVLPGGKGEVALLEMAL